MNAEKWKRMSFPSSWWLGIAVVHVSLRRTWGCWDFQHVQRDTSLEASVYNEPCAITKNTHVDDKCVVLASVAVDNIEIWLNSGQTVNKCKAVTNVTVPVSTVGTAKQFCFFSRPTDGSIHIETKRTPHRSAFVKPDNGPFLGRLICNVASLAVLESRKKWSAAFPFFLNGV